MESGEPVSVNKREYSELIRKQRERLRSAREEEKENAEMSSSSSSSVLAADAKLVPRITIYLEKNKDKVGIPPQFTNTVLLTPLLIQQYIDIEAMCKWLHNKYPEYNRKKYRVFKTQVRIIRLYYRTKSRLFSTINRLNIRSSGGGSLSKAPPGRNAVQRRQEVLQGRGRRQRQQRREEGGEGGQEGTCCCLCRGQV